MRLGNDFVVYPLRLQVDLLLVHWHLTCYQYIVVHSKFPATRVVDLMSAAAKYTQGQCTWITKANLIVLGPEWHHACFVISCLNIFEKWLAVVYMHWSLFYNFSWIGSGYIWEWQQPPPPPFTRSDILTREMRWYMTGAVIWIYGRYPRHRIFIELLMAAKDSMWHMFTLK